MASILGICGVCNNAIVSRFRHAGGATATDYVVKNLNFPSDGERVFAEYPKVDFDVPSDCPPPVERFYMQGLVNLRGKNWDAAGAMFRKSLDVATKILDPNRKDKNLFERINLLVQDKKSLLQLETGPMSFE